MTVHEEEDFKDSISFIYLTAFQLLMGYLKFNCNN